MWTILFDEAEERGIAVGERIGQIKGAVTLYHDELKLSPSEIIPRIIDRYSLTREEAERYVEAALKVQKV